VIDKIRSYVPGRGLLGVIAGIGVIIVLAGLAWSGIEVHHFFFEGNNRTYGCARTLQDQIDFGTTPCTSTAFWQPPLVIIVGASLLALRNMVYTHFHVRIHAGKVIDFNQVSGQHFVLVEGKTLAGRDARRWQYVDWRTWEYYRTTRPKDRPIISWK
jgi:hypothetical protein